MDHIPRLLNIACGRRLHSDWENIDFSPCDKRVKRVNLLRPLPYADNSFDVAYSSHFLEHLTPTNALAFLTEVRRILKPNGIVRIVVPDLAKQAQAYLNTLAQLLANNASNATATGGGGESSNKYHANI